MVTRVDKKPIIYNSTLLRFLRPSVSKGNKKLVELLLSKSVGHGIPKVPIREILDDYEDINYMMQLWGTDETYDEKYGFVTDAESDECIRIARSMVDRNKSRIGMLKADATNDAITKAQGILANNVSRIFYGTEAVYMLWYAIMTDNVFSNEGRVKYHDWCTQTAERIITTQAPYMFIHPSATSASCGDMANTFGYRVWAMWHKFKKTETILFRIASRKNAAAHNYYSGGKASRFDPSDCILDDFKYKITGYAKTKDHVSMYNMAGLKYVKIGEDLFVLSPDDCQNACLMAQAHFRTAMYFTEPNKYASSTTVKVIGLLKDMTAHCCKLITIGKNFSNFIRSLHILAQKDFNDIWEDTKGGNLGWEARSENYIKESSDLDKSATAFHNRIMDLAISSVDQLNVGFLYHAFIGDEMLIEDLRNKVKTMPSKVMPADKETWGDFIKFCKTYLLCRFLHVYKRKPKAAGFTSLLNEAWADKCIAGNFTMPPKTDWGKVWIQGEFTWTAFAETWHLEAQDVAYVPKDSKGLAQGKYKADKMCSSELLMAMTSGNILDELTGSTPRSARARIRANNPVSEVVLTTAPKAENAKPSWKKRVTFAADNEFRKMQSEYDRNCRKVMSFVRGPSLAVDQHVLEAQFRSICEATTCGLGGAICSHDISAWSESMDRDRKFEFEDILVTMLSEPNMINIKNDWAKIKATVLKQGSKDIIALDNGSFQGFDGSSSTILHAMILIYCIETARRAIGLSRNVKTDMATLIDDCVALMNNLDNPQDAIKFWDHLKETYKKLGFEVDELKSIFSTIKAIYLSRRFLWGAEVPADMKVFIKAHCSYEDPLRCANDIVSDIFGATRGACDGNGDVWFIYYTTVVTVLAELAHQVPCVTELDCSAAAICALAPAVENGWAFPSLIDWTTNDIMDKRTHFNAIIEAAAVHECASDSHKQGYVILSTSSLRMIHTIKSQAWRLVSYSNIFTNPFEAIREGPLKPDMLRRNAVSDLLRDVIKSEPWESLMKWSSSETTNKVRQYLIDSGPLHAPTLSALVNCMPDNYRLGMIGKAIGSNSLLNVLPRTMKIVLKRRVSRCSYNFYAYMVNMYKATHDYVDAEDLCVMSHVSKTIAEREEFYAANGVDMIDHTFPDPVAAMTHSSSPTSSSIGPNLTGLRIWDSNVDRPIRLNEYVSNSNLFVPPKSSRVWEVTSEYARGWDSVSQRIAMGLAVLARASADGHRTEGLLSYFIKSWNEHANITPADTQLISIHGSMKRLDSNPGSSNHPITAHRNILSGIEVNLKSCLDAIDTKAVELCGVASHLHDALAHKSALRSVTACMLALFVNLNVADHIQRYNIALRPDCVISASTRTMQTHLVAGRIDVEILDGAENYGLLQAAPVLAHAIIIPTMRAGWVDMINALISGDHAKCNELLNEAQSSNIDDLIKKLGEKATFYSTSVVVAQEPAARHKIIPSNREIYAVVPEKDNARQCGDVYTMSVKGIGSKFSRALTKDNPKHICAAIAIRSVVWDRAKKLSATALSKIHYDDPDADYKVLSDFTEQKFWRGVVSEVRRFGKGVVLSELIVSGFKSVNVGDIRINSTNDPQQVVQSIASYFGSHIKSVTRIIEQELLSITGRSSRLFDSPVVERMITNNPSLMNNKLRRDHLTGIIQHNIEMYNERIKALESDDPEKAVKHRGDMRAVSSNLYYRLVELRNRRAVYKHVRMDEKGRAVIDCKGILKYLAIAAKSVSEKNELNIDVPSSEDIDEQQDISLDDCIEFSEWFHKVANDACNEAEERKTHGWNSHAGTVGLRYAYDTITYDSNVAENTKYAVSAAEIAPVIYKRIKVVETGEPSLLVDEIDALDISWVDNEKESIVDKEGYLARYNPVGPASKRLINIPIWQALFALVVSGAYDVEEVNEKLNTTIAFDHSVKSVKSASLDMFEDGFLIEVFPSIIADYHFKSFAYNPDWEDDEGDNAYMVDEASGSGRGRAY